jgi:hypothetical protein
MAEPECIKETTIDLDCINSINFEQPKEVPINPTDIDIIPLNDSEEHKASVVSTVPSLPKPSNLPNSNPRNSTISQSTPISTISPPKRVPTKMKSEGEVLVGTPVKEGHVNYMLMYDMLTGIRISVSRCNAKALRDVTASDFIAAHKLAFDVYVIYNVGLETNLHHHPSTTLNSKTMHLGYLE